MIDDVNITKEEGMRKLSGKEKDKMDLKILQGISGCDDPEGLGFRVDDNYFEREYYENRLMAGYQVPEEWIPQVKSRKERDMWRRQFDAEKIESERVDYDPFDDSKYQKDEDDIPYGAKSMSVDVV